MQSKVKMWVDDLQLGMYVSQLDRPWVETPFIFQGFSIKSEKDIRDLGKYCKFVVVDTEKSLPSNNYRFAGTRAENKIEANALKPETGTTLVLPDNLSFKEQMRKALEVHRSAKQYIKLAMNDIRLGRHINIKQAKTFVKGLTENIMDNPTALIWLTQLKDKDEYTSIHSLNVCVLALFFGRSIGLNKMQLQELGIGALLHDIGKLRVPLEVLNKPGNLTDAEYGLMKKHTVYGYELFRNKDEISQASMNVIRNHHERLDGRGYPNGLGEQQIDYYSKMVTIVDVYDAITSKRVYHDEVNPYDALNRLYQTREGVFDQTLIEQFIKYMGVYPIGSLVELSTGHIGVVSAFNEKRHLYPTVLLLLDKNKQPLPRQKLINLASPKWDRDEKRPRIERIVNPGSYDVDLATVFLNETIQTVK